MSVPNPKQPMRRGLRALLRSRRGATAVEYGFILALIVVFAMGAISRVGNTTITMWNDIGNKVVNAR